MDREKHSVEKNSGSVKRKPAFTVVYDGSFNGLDIIAVNKSAGISVGGDRWDESKERLDKLLAATLGTGKIFTVHRIDRDTSGIIVFAKDAQTHKLLSAAFEERLVKKHYIAVVHGRPSWKETECDLPLVPNGNKLHHTIVDKYRGKPSLTRFKLFGSAGSYSVLEVTPETGRTHQIRVHLCSLGHPIVCDEIYGTTKPVFLSAIKRKWRGDHLDEQPLLSRLGLHSAELVLPAVVSPAAGDKTGEDFVLAAPLARDISALITQMKKAGSFT